MRWNKFITYAPSTHIATINKVKITIYNNAAHMIAFTLFIYCSSSFNFSHKRVLNLSPFIISCTLQCFGHLFYGFFTVTFSCHRRKIKTFPRWIRHCAKITLFHFYVPFYLCLSPKYNLLMSRINIWIQRIVYWWLTLSSYFSYGHSPHKKSLQHFIPCSISALFIFFAPFQPALNENRCHYS